ncbi:hypothetical protein KTF24_12005 [Burkholderia multivorans]|nr:hypothetical protein [Burkholderia multivorans]MBU9668505.1 hypothetical protein [Burkholderia multivorans]HEF4753999.1 hypothetical protein [Burkholderia multivorans]
MPRIVGEQYDFDRARFGRRIPIDEVGFEHAAVAVPGLRDRGYLLGRRAIDSKIGGRRYVLTFETVSRFDYNHDAANDGLILSCSVTIADGAIEFACNPWDQPPGPFVREVVRIPGGGCGSCALAFRRRFPVESPVLRASYNGHYLSFPSPSALIKTTNHAHSPVVFSPGSTKNHCSCGVHGDASFHPTCVSQKLQPYALGR